MTGTSTPSRYDSSVIVIDNDINHQHNHNYTEYNNDNDDDDDDGDNNNVNDDDDDDDDDVASSNKSNLSSQIHMASSTLNSSSTNNYNNINNNNNNNNNMTLNSSPLSSPSTSASSSSSSSSTSSNSSQPSSTLPLPASSTGTTPKSTTALFWLVAWFSLNVGTTLLGKAIFTNLSFPYPVTMCIVHMIATGVLTRVQMSVQGVPLARLQWRDHMWLAVFSTIFCLNIVVGNSSLRYASVALVQVVRAVIPGITLCLSVPLLGQKFTHEHIMAVLVVVIGVGCSAYGDLECTAFGLTLTLAGCLLAALKGIAAKSFLSGALKLHPLDLAYRMSVLAGLQMALIGLAVGEYPLIFARKQELLDQGAFYVLAFHGVMAFFLNYSNFSLTQHTSALAVSIAGSIKNATTIFLSILLFATPVTLLNGIGTFIAIGGAAWYTKIEYIESKRRTTLHSDSRRGRT